MNLLVLNCGSTTLKYKLFETGDHVPRSLAAAAIPLGATHGGRLGTVLARLPQLPEAIAHRIVHGGDRHGELAMIDDTVLAELRSEAPRSPLHNTHAIELVEAATRLKLPQVAAFDGAFHGTLPLHARRYALPDIDGVHRVGFHGWSHRCVTERYAAMSGNPTPTLVTLRLGGAVRPRRFARDARWTPPWVSRLSRGS